MDWQQAISLIIVTVAVVALVWGMFARRKFRFNRDTHCGCSMPGPSETPQRIIFRARKGARPEVHVKAQ